MLLRMAFCCFMTDFSSLCVSHLLYLSPVSGHLACFRVLAVGNSDAVNIGVRVSFRIKFSSLPDIYPGLGLLDHMVTLCLVS